MDYQANNDRLMVAVSFAVIGNLPLMVLNVKVRPAIECLVQYGREPDNIRRSLIFTS